MGLTVGVDIGGTKIAAGVVDEDGAILTQVTVPTPDESGKVLDAIAETFQQVRTEHNIEAVGLSAAGPIDEKRATVVSSPNVAWRAVPLRDEIEQRVELPVVVENDANAAAWGEARFGAGKSENHLLFVIVGTGIGGGIVLDGALYRGRFGMAGEIGHICVVPGGLRCGCGNKGCLEQYASGQALVREAREVAQFDSAVAARLRELAGDTAEGITGPIVTQVAREGDPVAIDLFAELGRWLGVGLANLAAVLDPGCIVLGGGVSEAGELLLKPTREAFHRSLVYRGHWPEAEIRLAQLGAEAGLVGAADLARRR